MKEATELTVLNV